MYSSPADFRRQPFLVLREKKMSRAESEQKADDALRSLRRGGTATVQNCRIAAQVERPLAEHEV
jgi:hypothetical protein